MNPLSLCQLTVETGAASGGSMADDILRLIPAAAAAGFSAIVPRVRQAAGIGPASADDDKPMDVAEIRRRLADTGLKVAGAMSYWMTPETDPRGFAASMDAAAGMGALSIQVVCRDPEEARAQVNFAQTCAMAASRGLKVSLEFMAYSSIRSLAAARAFVAGAGQKNAGLCVDALHFFRSDSSLAELAALDPEEIVLIQFCDAGRKAPAPDKLRDEARGGRLYPGEGELALDKFFAALPPGCLLDIEAPCAADVGLTMEEKARKAAAATRAFLARQRA